MFTMADCEPPTGFVTIWIAGNAFADDVLNVSAIDPPKALSVELATARSGETAALNAYRVELVTFPESRSAPFGAISYQRTSAPAPPLTVCCVQTPSRPSEGSNAATACVSRASDVSSRFFVRRCGASGGTE